MDVFNPITKLLPRQTRLKYRQMIIYSKFKTDPDTFMGFVLILGLLLGLALGLLLFMYLEVPVWIGAISSFIVIELALYMIVQLSADSKAKEAEEVLPDALQLMSSNIRAGLTTDKALLLAARPEFGHFCEEIKRIGKETMAGQDLGKSLMKTSKNIKSVNLERTLGLIVQSLNSGGKLADLLDQTANDLRDQQMIQKEVAASVLMYVMFIFIAIGIGAPLLFSMSSFLVALLTTNLNMISADMPDMESIAAQGGALPISMSGIDLDPAFVRTYSIVSLTVTAVLGSMVIGLIMSGEERSGLKFIPILILLCMALFFIGSFALNYMFGDMMQLR